MKCTSKVIMGATLILVLSLALVLSLILVLLAELYCSLLSRRRRSTQNDIAATVDHEAAPTQLQNGSHESSSAPTSTFGRFYSHGVLNNAPRSFLFPSSLSSKHEQQLSGIELLGAPVHDIRILSSTPPSLSTLLSNPEAKQEEQGQVYSAVANEGLRLSRRLEEHHRNLQVYISNPIFDEEEAEDNYKINGGAAITPYATPDTSPSRLGNTGGSSSDEEEDG